MSGNTLQHYHYMVGPFFDWLRGVHPEVEGFEDLDVAVIRHYPADLSTHTSERTGRPWSR